ncbi:hypothetical protein BDZ94DRAFT_1262186, partial [Collybia nuda]
FPRWVVKKGNFCRLILISLAYDPPSLMTHFCLCQRVINEPQAHFSTFLVYNRLLVLTTLD